MEKHHTPQRISRRRLLIIYWGPVLVWMTTIFILSMQREHSVAPEYWLNFAFFKTLHLIEYVTLFTLSYRASSATFPERRKKWGVVAFVIAVLYAASDEFHQGFTPTRDPTLRDVIIDASGAALAWIFLTRSLPKAPKILRVWANRLGIPS